VAAPLADTGMTKAEIRELSRLAGLPTRERPASACLSSRIPYGTPVTIQNVKTVETGEEEIKALGFRQFRVRWGERHFGLEKGLTRFVAAAGAPRTYRRAFSCRQ